MPGQIELLIIALLIPGVICALGLAGLSRLRKKLAAGSKPTWSTYVNELGGYVIVALVFLLGGMAMLVEGCLRPMRPDIQVPFRHESIEQFVETTAAGGGFDMIFEKENGQFLNSTAVAVASAWNRR